MLEAPRIPLRREIQNEGRYILSFYEEMLDNVCIPINLDAFVLNKASCDTKGSTVLVAPITQPDYVGLRLDSSVIQVNFLKSLTG